MHRTATVLSLAIATALLTACHTRANHSASSLAEMKRTQENRLMYACIVQYGTMVHGGLSLDLIQACQRQADSRVW